MVHVMEARLGVVDRVRVQATDVVVAGVMHDLKDDLFGGVLGPMLHERLKGTTCAGTIEADPDDPELDVLPCLKEGFIQDI